ncbi:tRNA pseudouridine(38-40) synthase TruA [Nocardioides sp. Kera G14]|uniref:tRNA pseudouridine(38-40) synthase TruA n=1 Tax=Nocardioides sp. Kera G14 TaxID=2884264 RepID=UPI001D114F4C|nr:tRNA pseudouridine(38-40) synthase TruA [Nocardioides sp. Kera G14]UDY24287.1 tRNA pseudouridine(38-40) synthase TruA [Nocardioides sp. Kera G14]
MRIRIDFAYDGTDFSGWAMQPGLRTVQGELQAALAQALRLEEAWVTVAGRTDAGVHARGQVCHVDVDEPVLVQAAGRSPQTPVDALTRRLNGILPPDIRIHRSSEAPAYFDARFSATWRRYAYRVADDTTSYDPLRRHHVLHWPRPLDVGLMNRAAADLVGLRDFTTFCKAREGSTAIRELRELRWEREPDGTATATVLADAFCHSMVRSLVGCLIAIGEGRKDVSWARAELEAQRRSSSIHLASPRGLVLEEVGYPPDEELEGRLLITKNRRTADEVDA